MTIAHHLDDATLLSYAGGTLPRHLRIVAASHIELCAQCRKAARATAELGAGLALAESEDGVRRNLKDAVMARINTATLHRFPAPRARQPGELPHALARETGLEHFTQLPWRKAGPGIEVARLPQTKGEKGFFGLLRVQPGAKIPDHGHGGTELTLVLKGTYHDAMGQFQAGDIADLDAAIVHQPVADGAEACICLIANDAPSRFRSIAAKLLQPFIGI